jgi:hypothetical protein
MCVLRPHDAGGTSTSLVLSTQKFLQTVLYLYLVYLGVLAVFSSYFEVFSANFWDTDCFMPECFSHCLCCPIALMLPWTVAQSARESRPPPVMPGKITG